MTKYIGLDFETTGLDVCKHAPLSLGVAWEEGDSIESHEFYFNVAQGRSSLFDVGSLNVPEWEIGAWNVNGIDPRQMDGAPNGGKFSTELDVCEWFIDAFGNDFGQLVAVGWNVGSFDLQFIRHWFPHLLPVFTHRPFELNTLAYACDTTFSVEEGTYKKWVKAQIEEQISPRWHNAEFDAWASLRAKQLMDQALIED